MKRSLFILAFIFSLSLSLHAQHVLKFTNTDGFPDVVVQGQSYTLSGWIKNYGSASGSSPSVYRIHYSVNGGSSQQVGGNYNLGSLAPGDSVYWQSSPYTFVASQFSGHHNDILIWPTVPNQNSGDTRSDSIQMTMYFATPTQAAFSLRDQNVIGFDAKVDPKKAYSVTFGVTNEGPATNTQPVQLFAEDGNGNSFKIAEDPGFYQSGSFFSFSFSDFRLLDLVPQANVVTSDQISFFAVESKNIPPVHKASILLDQQITGISNPRQEGLDIYPNPSQGMLNFNFDLQANPSDVTWSIYDAKGRRVLQGKFVPRSLNLSHLQEGTYIFLLDSKQERLSKKFILN